MLGQGVRETVQQQAAVGQAREVVVERPLLEQVVRPADLRDVLELADVVQRRPVAVEEFQISAAETYDVIVTPSDDRASITPSV